MSSTLTSPALPLTSPALPLTSPALSDNLTERFKERACLQTNLFNIQIANVTAYYQDSLTQLATKSLDPINPASLGNNFYPLEVAGDIVGINGDTKVKGLYLSRNLVTTCSPTPSAGTMISDTSIIGFRQDIFKILYPDPMSATPATMEIGSITASGVSGQPESPGEPPPITGGDWAITGGTGAFLGVTGQMGGEKGAGNIRAASVQEDPSRRRMNASPNDTGTIGLYVIPMCPPQIIEVFDVTRNHLVDNFHPAHANDQLILYASGLGPVRYQNAGVWVHVPIGQPFPADTTVISPVTVTVGNTTVPIAPLKATGLPGFNNVYSVQFNMPIGPYPPGPFPGTTLLQITSAWIQSAVFPLYVQ